MVSVNGNGEFTPAHDVASTSVFVPTSLTLTFTFTPTGGPAEPPETDTTTKAAPIKNTVTCDIPLQTLFWTGGKRDHRGERHGLLDAARVAGNTSD